jgi:hypothetical protein
LLSISLLVNQDAWARGRRQSRRSGGQSSGATHYTPAPTQPAANKTQVSANASTATAYLAVPAASSTSLNGYQAAGYVLVPYSSMPSAQSAVVVYGLPYPATNGAYTLVPAGTQTPLTAATIGQQ